MVFSYITTKVLVQNLSTFLYSVLTVESSNDRSSKWSSSKKITFQLDDKRKLILELDRLRSVIKSEQDIQFK